MSVRCLICTPPRDLADDDFLEHLRTAHENEHASLATWPDGELVTYQHRSAGHLQPQASQTFQAPNDSPQPGEVAPPSSGLVAARDALSLELADALLGDRRGAR